MGDGPDYLFEAWEAILDARRGDELDEYTTTFVDDMLLKAGKIDVFEDNDGSINEIIEALCVLKLSDKQISFIDRTYEDLEDDRDFRRKMDKDD